MHNYDDCNIISVESLLSPEGFLDRIDGGNNFDAEAADHFWTEWYQNLMTLDRQNNYCSDGSGKML